MFFLVYEQNPADGIHTLNQFLPSFHEGYHLTKICTLPTLYVSFQAIVTDPVNTLQPTGYYPHRPVQHKEMLRPIRTVFLSVLFGSQNKHLLLTGILQPREGVYVTVLAGTVSKVSANLKIERLIKHVR